jgi:hypothetical protein
MAYSTIIKPNTQMNPLLYTGNTSNGHAITGLGFQPDFVWIKSRNQANFSHMLYDVVRTAVSGPFDIRSNATNAQSTDSSGLVSFDSDGFTLNNGGYVNTGTFVSWNWKAGGSPSSNTDGSITSSVSANTTNGFSIVTYTGTESAATVGHGLGSAPKMIFAKQYSGAADWKVLPPVLGATRWLKLNTTDAAGTSAGNWNNTSPTSSVFSLGNDAGINGSGQTMVAYCFADVKGFSKMGWYQGNGSTDGTFVYTGFKPAFVLMKNTADGGASWQMFDNKRDVDNVANHRLFPNSDAVESTDANNNIDIISNGFKMRTSNGDNNANGSTFIYMAFAENPLVANTSGGIPTTAR